MVPRRGLELYLQTKVVGSFCDVRPKKRPSAYLRLPRLRQIGEPDILNFYPSDNRNYRSR